MKKLILDAVLSMAILAGLMFVLNKWWFA